MIRICGLIKWAQERTHPPARHGKRLLEGAIHEPESRSSASVLDFSALRTEQSISFLTFPFDLKVLQEERGEIGEGGLPAIRRLAAETQDRVGFKGPSATVPHGRPADHSPSSKDSFPEPWSGLPYSGLQVPPFHHPVLPTCECCSCFPVLWPKVLT